MRLLRRGQTSCGLFNKACAVCRYRYDINHHDSTNRSGMSALAAPQAPIKSGSIRMGSVPNNLSRSVRRGTAGSKSSWGPVASPAEAATMKARAIAVLFGCLPC